MDFAPYQSSPPEHGRTLSPGQESPASPRASLERRPFSPSHYPKRPNQSSPPPLQHPQPQRNWHNIPSSNYQPTNGGGGGDGYFGNIGGGLASDREGLSEFDTSLGIRLDYEACLAYLAVPPLGAILLLILERKSDYVRFHAWQSSLLFTAIFVVHLIFSWSTILSWLILLGDFALIAWLTMRAYRDADTLDRFELPVFGPIASRILDDE
ncbi:hypothetical protein NKR23_g6921 [Pleurostoma richardsiae]|uniref:Uncharacterized protein n=1 Tax=Pleurostoma richardsiae TaxID=41990 RepID=A0AA38RNE3_9PEZI|nr:hypothetical protein NKR23_g6921 [Pleurostoma richardsiae]